MKLYKELEDLNFFKWLDETHNLGDTDMKPEYLDELPLGDIHRTVCNAMVFRWFREKHGLNSFVYHYGEDGILDTIYFAYNINDNLYASDFRTHEEAELACLKKLIETIR